MTSNDDVHPLWPRRIEDEDTQDWYRTVCGFESGEMVLTYGPSFTLEEARESLFSSTYSRPRTITLAAADGSHRLPVVLTKAESVFVPYQHGPAERALGCWEYPEWRFEGFIQKSGSDPFPDIIRVRIYARTDGNAALSLMLWQRIPENPEPEGWIEVDCHP